MKSSNPVLSRLGQAAERERTAGYGYSEPYPTQGYPAAPPVARSMSIDDVVVKTVKGNGKAERVIPVCRTACP